MLVIHVCFLHRRPCPYQYGDGHTNGMYVMIIDMVHDHNLLRDSQVHPKSRCAPINTQDEVSEARVALVAKVNISIDATGVKGETLFPVTSLTPPMIVPLIDPIRFPF